MNPRIIDVTTTDEYILELVFDNGERGSYNCSGLLDFGIFKQLKDLSYFHRARTLDGTVVWPNGQDICPDTLYLDSTKQHAA
ncbi:MAG: DUF2442 domain-containing protein [Gammaproteobacteria bacterium]